MSQPQNSTSTKFLDRVQKLDDRTLLAIVVLVGFLVFANSLGNGFALDDVVIVEQNALIQSLNNTWKIFTTGFWQEWFGGTSRYRPLFTFTLALDYQIWKLNPFGYHLTNILLHAANSGFFFILARKYELSRRIAFIAALVFAVHPIHTEAVSNIVGRMEVLGTFFCGISWYFWKREPQRQFPSPLNLILSVIFFLCAVLSKENFAIFPVGLFVAEWYVKKPDFTPRALIRFGLPFGAFILGLGIYFAFRRLSGELVTANASIPLLLSDYPIWKRCLVMADASLEWYRLLMIGFPLKPSYDQYNYPLKPFLTLRSGVGILAFTGLLGLLVVTFRRQPVIFFSIFFFVSQIFVVSNIIVPVGVLIAERWAYLPSAGFCLILAWGFDRLLKVTARETETSRRNLVYALLGTLLASYAAGTVIRNPDWKDNLSLFSRFMETDPQHPTGYTAIADWFIEEEDPQSARLLLVKALRVSPGNTDALRLLAALNLREDRLQEAEEQIDAIMAVEPPALPPNTRIAQTHFIKAGIRFIRGDLETGTRELEFGIRYSPTQYFERLTLSNLLVKRNCNEAGIIVLKTLIRTHPDLPQPYNNLGVALMRMGKLEEAKSAFEMTLKKNPGHVQAGENLKLVIQKIEEKGRETTRNEKKP
jgi:tetratricopeptide (TPR) repeat protein